MTFSFGELQSSLKSGTLSELVNQYLLSAERLGKRFLKKLANRAEHMFLNHAVDANMETTFVSVGRLGVIMACIMDSLTEA